MGASVAQTPSPRETESRGIKFTFSLQFFVRFLPLFITIGMTPRLGARPSLFFLNFVERLRESCICRHRFKANSTFILMLTNGFEYY
jgi:hypothetical protein